MVVLPRQTRTAHRVVRTRHRQHLPIALRWAERPTPSRKTQLRPAFLRRRRRQCHSSHGSVSVHRVKPRRMHAAAITAVPAAPLRRRRRCRRRHPILHRRRPRDVDCMLIVSRRRRRLNAVVVVIRVDSIAATVVVIVVICDYDTYIVVVVVVVRAATSDVGAATTTVNAGRGTQPQSRAIGSQRVSRLTTDR